MIIIRKLHKEFPHRVVEWGMSYVLATWGLVLLIKPGLFEGMSQPAYAGWASIAPQHVWGTAAFTIGVLRWAGLYVNGAHSRSPILRTVMGFLSMFIWFWATVGVLRIEISTALACYPWFMVADGYAVYVAAGDAYQSLEAERRKRPSHGNIKRVH